MGLPVSAMNVDDTVALILDRSQSAPFLIGTPNLNFVRSSRKSRHFRDNLLLCNLLLVDGMPIVWTAKLLGLPITQRCPGSTVVKCLFEDAGKGVLTVGIYGGEQPDMEAVVRWVENHSQVEILGQVVPGIGSIDYLSQPRFIEPLTAKPFDLLLTCLSGDKGVNWIAKNHGDIPARVFMQVGAGLNFLSGSVRRAPETWQKAGLEWLWRTAMEPRLMTRYLFDGLFFIKTILTRTLPLALLLRQNRKGRFIEPGFQYKGSGFALFGSLTDGAHLADIISSLAAHDGEDLSIDFSEVTHMGCEMVAALLKLKAKRDSLNRPLRLTGLPLRLKLLLWLCMAEDLLYLQ